MYDVMELAEVWLGFVDEEDEQEEVEEHVVVFLRGVASPWWAWSASDGWAWL